MDKHKAGYLVLMFLALLIAGVLTWSLMNSKEYDDSYYGLALGFYEGPSDKQVVKGRLAFEKVEEDKNDR